MAMFEREPDPRSVTVTQITSGADAEDERVLSAAFAELAAEASEIERTAIALDRAEETEQALSVYRQAAERMAKAAALCPEGNPDRAMLAKHAGEIYGRVVYLESLGEGALATVPPEAHIGSDSLDADGFQVLRDPRGRSEGSSPNWRQKAVSAAAVSGAAGLLVLHAPVCALGLAAGAAYATTRQDSAGEAARSMGCMGIQAAEHVKQVAHQHRVADRASEALSGVRSLDERWRVSERTQAFASSSVSTLRDLDQRHQVTSSVASGARRASAKLVEAVTPAVGWATGTQGLGGGKSPQPTMRLRPGPCDHWMNDGESILSRWKQAAFNATQRLLSGGLVCAGHDRSDGGLLTAVLEMAFAGRKGIELKLDDAGPGTYMEKLFSEAPGLVYEVRRADLAAVARIFESEGVSVQEIGSTRKDLKAVGVVHVGKECVLDADVASLHCIWEATSFQLERQQCYVPCVEQEEAGFKNRRVPPYKLSYTPEPTADAAPLRVFSVQMGRRTWALGIGCPPSAGSTVWRSSDKKVPMVIARWRPRSTWPALRHGTPSSASASVRVREGCGVVATMATNYAPLLPLSVGSRSVTGYMTGTTPNAGSGTYASQAAMGAFGRPLSTPNSVRQRSPPGHEKDVVQFFSKTFYVSETEDSAVVRVIRIGSLQGTCDVTLGGPEDEGARSFGQLPRGRPRRAWYTEDFSAVAGRKYIGGEGILNFGPGESVKIINDDNFDTALETFRPRDARRARRLGGAVRVAQVRRGSFKEFDVILTEPRNCVLDPRYKTSSDPEAEERLWIPGDRNGTAVCLGLAWVLPNIILLASDYFEMKGLEMGFNIRNHLRVNLFRKYLRYTSESRAAVPVQDLKIAIMEDGRGFHDGYLIIFELWAMLGKIGMVTIFMLKKTPGTALQTLAFYPILIALYLWCTYKRRLDLMGKEPPQHLEKKTIVVRHFEEVLKTQRKHVMDLKSFSFWNSQLIPWITLLAIGFYIGGSAQMVLGGRISLGALDLGDRFSTILDGLKSLSKAISPLGALTVQFNLEVDIPQKAAVFKTNEKFALSHGQKNFDLIPIAFKNISIDQSPTFRGGTDFTEEAPQGSVIQIVGPHDSGKGAILRRICDIDSEAPGMVLISPHLTVLQVPHEPLFLESGGVFSNLHMRTTARGRRILERLGLGKEWILNLYDQEESGSLEHVAEEKLAPTSPFSCFEEEEEEEEEEDEICRGELRSAKALTPSEQGLVLVWSIIDH
eukprot:g31653.t1